jgi:hypothetical protein
MPKTYVVLFALSWLLLACSAKGQTTAAVTPGATATAPVTA